MKKLVILFLVSILLMLSACAAQPPVAASLAPTPTTDLVAAQLTSMAATAAVSSPAATATDSQSAAATATPAATAAAAVTTAELNTSYDNAVSVELQLLLGTLNLRGTEQAVTKDQASVLLPLWTSLKTLTQGAAPAQAGDQAQPGNATPQAPTISTETQQQVDALLKQIQAAMTPAQIKAIADMKITQDTAMTIMRAQGLTRGGPQGNGNGAGPSGGQQPQGTPPAGGPGGAPSDNGTPPAGGQPPSNGQGGGAPANTGMTPPGLIDAVIQQLQNTTASQ
jgi:hypothetical protein